LVGEPTEWIETARYLGVTLGTRITLSAQANQMRKKAAQRLDVLDHLFSRRGGLSVRKGMLLCKQHIRPLMYYACPISRFAVRSYAWKLQVLQCKPNVFALRVSRPGTLVKGEFTRI
jgi:hypothetical protein